MPNGRCFQINYLILHLFSLWSRNTHSCYLSICSQHLTGVPNEHFSQNWLYDVVNASKVLLRQPMLIFKFLGKKNPLFTARVGWFSRALTCFARSNIHIKKYSTIARRENIPFYPAKTGINFSYFQLARRSFRFPSQLISQCFFFQLAVLAQILPEEQVFRRAAPSGTPDLTFF